MDSSVTIDLRLAQVRLLPLAEKASKMLALHNVQHAGKFIEKPSNLYPWWKRTKTFGSKKTLPNSFIKKELINAFNSRIRSYDTDLTPFEYLKKRVSKHVAKKVRYTRRFYFEYENNCFFRVHNNKFRNLEQLLSWKEREVYNIIMGIDIDSLDNPKMNVPTKYWIKLCCITDNLLDSKIKELKNED